MKKTFKKEDMVFDLEHGDLNRVVSIESDQYFTVQDFDEGDIWPMQAMKDFARARPIIFSTQMVQAILMGNKTQTRRIIKPMPSKCWLRGDGLMGWDSITGHPQKNKEPKYHAGEVLYVRETWAPVDTPFGHYIYKADYNKEVTIHHLDIDRWRPSIHMPAKAARLFLRIEEVGVERLQDISENDAIREGIPNGPYAINAVDSFKKLWDGINKDRASWHSNPWVWVIKFQRLNN